MIKNTVPEMDGLYCNHVVSRMAFLVGDARSYDSTHCKLTIGTCVKLGNTEFLASFLPRPQDSPVTAQRSTN